jgi:hypothetical protein
MWKRFNFFDKKKFEVAQQQTQGPADQAEGTSQGGEQQQQQQSNSGLYPETATCCTSGKGLVSFGCDNGEVYTLAEGWQTSCMFQAHDRRTNFIAHLKQRNFLLTFGLDDDSRDSSGRITLKVWDYNRLHPTSGPVCLRTIRPFTSKFYPKGSAGDPAVTVLSVHEEKTPNMVVTLGLSNGAVLIIRGDVVREKVSRIKLEVTTNEGDGNDNNNQGVTGLGYHTEGQSLILFVVTKNRSQGYNLGPVGSTFQPIRLFDEPEGAALHCTVMTPDNTFAVGRTEAVFIYGVDGKGPCFVFEGEKHKLLWFKRYLCSLSRRPGGSNRDVLTIYDLKNKMITFSTDVEEVAHIVYEWDTLHVLLKNPQQSFVLKEKAMSTKLELLFRKNLYNVALQLAQYDSDEGLVADIYRKYGDHLYNKQDYDNAMQQYLLTIGEVEPSYVIRKFLDAQRIPSLASYLESLHHHEMANADHTTLLLNCYTKLKDVTKLDAFIHVDNEVKPEDYIRRFDIETAIKVCRSSGYYDHALYVAEHAGETSWYLRILLEDCQRYEDALTYLSNLSSHRAVEALKKYGKMLVTSRPEETTALLMRLCTPGGNSSEQEFGASSHPPAKPADFIHLFAQQPRALMVFFEFVLNSGPEPLSENILYTTLLELYLTSKLTDNLDPMAPSRPVWQQMSPVVGGSGGGAKEEDVSAEYKDRLEKAFALLKKGWSIGDDPKYDAENALVICHLHCFTRGVVFLYERMKMYRDVLKVYMDSNDCSGLIEAVMRLGDESYGGDPRLWIDVLEFFGRFDGNCSEQVKEVLAHIESRNLLPPVVVLQILSQNTHLTLSVVKDYMSRVLKDESAIIEEDKKAIQKYRREATSMQKELKDLKTQARVFQNSKCSACSAPLELPAVHFLCMHSFHSRCLGENERECPICTPQNYTIMDMRRSQRAVVAEPDKFFTQLQHSSDGFAVVAEYFGRGLMNL